MPLEHFRKRQKLIYWIVALVVIPSFVLVWGTGVGSSGGGGRTAGSIAQVFGRNVDVDEFQAFHRRLSAALGGQGLEFYLPMPDPMTGQWRMNTLPPDLTMLLAMGLLHEAEQAGIGVAEIEIGAALQKHPVLAPYASKPEELRQHYDALLADYKLTSTQFQQGLAEWITIRKYIDAMDATALATPRTAYLNWAREEAKFKWIRTEVKVTPEMEEQALNALMGVTPEHPEEDEEKANQAVEAYLAQHASQRRWWTEPKVRFEYVLAPFDAYTPEVSDEELKEHYESTKFLYEEKPFEEVREAVLADLLKQRRRELAQATITRDLEDYLTATESPTLAGIEQQTVLSRRGIKTGVSGEKVVPADELATVEALGPCRSLESFFERLDQLAPEKRQEEVQKLKDRFDMENPPLECEKGFIRVRLLEFEPGVPRTLRQAEGKIDRALRTEVMLELQKQDAMKLAQARAKELAVTLAEQGAGAVENVETKEGGARDLPPGMMMADIGQPLEPTRTLEGWEILMLTERSIPAEAVWLDRPAEERREDLQAAQSALRGRMLPLPQATFVMPGARLLHWATTALETKNLTMLQPRQAEQE